LATSHKIGASQEIQLIGGDHKFQKKPAFLAERNAMFDRLYLVQKEKYATMPKEPITITLPDGNTKQGVSFETTPLMVAKMISSQLAKKIIVSEVRYPNGRVATLDDKLQNPNEEDGEKGEGWMDFDVTRPLEGNCEIRLLQFTDDKGRETFWHSSAHILGETLEQDFGVHLTHGPPTQDGFFYDSYTGVDVSIYKILKVVSNSISAIAFHRQKLRRH
jgi:threonyl-tRNA synthetase